MSKRKSLLVAGLAAAAILTPTTPASAEDFCNTTTDGPFDGTTICVVNSSPLPPTYLTIPYSVGAVCVGGICTPAASGTIDVPLVRDPLDVYGTICVTTRTRICRSFSDDIVIGST